MNLKERSIAGLFSIPLPDNLLAPAKALTKALTSPGLARDHSLSRDLRTFLANGYEIVDFVLDVDAPMVSVSLQKGEDARVIESDDLAFVTYAATKVPREQARQRSRTESGGGLQ